MKRKVNSTPNDNEEKRMCWCVYLCLEGENGEFSLDDLMDESERKQMSKGEEKCKLLPVIHTVYVCV